ncbi:hypothetical protein SAMN04487911_12314 [Arenibacter nanhaiticus]|uniref:Uncharacterized protein n=1 Tax=Arenibacter nanhaiticus TaxID=558155 RepID=A0A1M6JTR1_9FLAO|nr:hypothetical protein [Arenibacter nanhaiticus]SHJ50125.1 hypothetical protein SAMN04487911_12314 [Arenibacter nanhaiticus]
MKRLYCFLVIMIILLGSKYTRTAESRDIVTEVHFKNTNSATAILKYAP